MTLDATSAPALVPPSDDPAHPRSPGPVPAEAPSQAALAPAPEAVSAAFPQARPPRRAAHVEGHTVDAVGRQWLVLSLTLSSRTFLELCHHGAELEDMEENGDPEPDAEAEPSLGAMQMVDQGRWTDGNRDGGCDRELATADDEPSLGNLDSLMGDHLNWSGGDRLDREQQCDDEGVDDDREPSLGFTTPGRGATGDDWSDREEGFGPSQATVGAARARYREKQPRLVELVLRRSDGETLNFRRLDHGAKP